MQSYTEIGGLRYGSSFWISTNFTWPFATLTASPNEVSIRVSLGRLWARTFALESSQIKSISKTLGLMSTGIVIEHSNVEYPPLILFWTFRYETLKEQLEAVGHSVFETKGESGPRD
jgi:hypothetical protein